MIGNETPRNPGLLLKVANYLRLRGYRELVRLKDSRGVYAYLMLDKHENPCYVVAKGSRVYKNMVSTQTELLQKARESGKAIVMAVLLPEQPFDQLEFFVFNPHEVWVNVIGDNQRYDEQMVNFPFDLGRPFKWEESSLDKIKVRMDGQKTLC